MIAKGSGVWHSRCAGFVIPWCFARVTNTCAKLWRVEQPTRWNVEIMMKHRWELLRKDNKIMRGAWRTLGRRVEALRHRGSAHAKVLEPIVTDNSTMFGCDQHIDLMTAMSIQRRCTPCYPRDRWRRMVEQHVHSATVTMTLPSSRYSEPWTRWKRVRRAAAHVLRWMTPHRKRIRFEGNRPRHTAEAGYQLTSTQLMVERAYWQARGFTWRLVTDAEGQSCDAVNGHPCDRQTISSNETCNCNREEEGDDNAKG